MKRLSALLFVFALFGLLQVPAQGQAPPIKKEVAKVVVTPAPGASFRHLDGHSIVFVADGVADSSVTGDQLHELNVTLRLGLCVQKVAWTRTGSVLGDLTDCEAQLAAATTLANLACQVRRDCPNSRVFFVGHSAGAHVVLAAAGKMPEKSVDRIILLSSAVSCVYDLKPALRASRYGIDNFWSSEDSVLDAAIVYATTADGTKFPCAGRVGIHVASNCPEDVAAYRNVRQYRWQEDLCGSGGHFAWTLQPTLKKCVAPLFFSFPVVHEVPVVVPRRLPEVKNLPPPTK